MAGVLQQEAKTLVNLEILGHTVVWFLLTTSNSGTLPFIYAHVCRLAAWIAGNCRGVGEGNTTAIQMNRVIPALSIQQTCTKWCTAGIHKQWQTCYTSCVHDKHCDLGKCYHHQRVICGIKFYYVTCVCVCVWVGDTVGTNTQPGL